MSFRKPFARRVIPAIALACGLALASPAAMARELPADLAARLTPEQQRAFVAWRDARAAFDRALDIYWAQADEMREVRKQKRQARQPFTTADYVIDQPPKYIGPPIPPDVERIIVELRGREPVQPAAGVADFLAAARQLYGFVPTPTSERDFKRRYAEEALAAGLSKMQVVRVFALETGGRGTFDMQAGIDPDTRKGNPISSALGYAQLLGANSVSELVRHGEHFIQRLELMASAPGTQPSRAAQLRGKAQVLRRMLKAARSVPNEWRHHTTLATTPKGLGIHTLNLDADVGPWLQVLKLKGLLETAAREANRTRLTGAELELMNLAGPRTGLEMMDPVGRMMPTANFFSRGGYYRNTIVRDKSAAGLLAALDERMEQQLKKPGSIEFMAAFDDVQRRRGAMPAAPPPATVAPVHTAPAPNPPPRVAVPVVPPPLAPMR